MMDERNLPQTVRQSLNALDHSAKLELLEQHKKENKKPLWKRISFGAKPKAMDSSRSSTVETNYTRISESSLNEEARIEKQFNHYLNNSNLSDETRAIMSKYDLQQKKLYVDRFQNNDIDKAFSAVLIAMQMNETERMNLSKQSKEEKIAIIQRYNELTKNKGRYRNKPLPTPVEEQYPNNNKPAISSSNSDSKISGNSLGTVLNPPPYKTELPRLHHSLSGSNPSNPASTLSRSTFESSRPPKSTISMSSSKSSFRGENRERILKNYQKDNAKIENKRSKEALEPRRSLNSYSSFQNIPKEPLVLFPELRKRAGSIGTESLSNPQSNLPYHGTPRIDHSSFPENSPEWFIVNLANRNTSLKALFRYLTSLRLKLAMKNDNFLVDFVNSIVSYSGSIGVNGISTLEISLDRVCTPFYQSETLKRRLYESKGTKGGKPDTDKPLPFIPGPLSWYADSVLPDELRLEVIRCVELIMKNDVGMTAILSSGGLIRQILWCYALPKPLIQEQMLKDRRLTSAYIELLSTISGIIGPACIVDDNLKNIVIQVVHELQKYQNESMPFYFLVNSLRNPIFPSDKSTTKRYSLANVTMLLDLSTIWYFRTQTMVFFNGFVSSSDSIFERSKLRKMLEACGLYKIIQDLLSRSPSEEFLVQAKSYLQDRENDLKVQERTFKTKTEMMGDSRAIVESLFQAIGTFPDPSMAAHFLTLTLQNLANIFSKVKEKNGNQTIADLQQRENTAKIFRLVENSTRSLYSSIENLQIDQMNSVGLSANLESEFLLAIENELGISLRPSEKINQNSSEELLQLREKVYELQRRNNALLRKINEPGNMSRSYRLESAFDTPEQILEKERRKKLELNLPSDSFGTNFFDSMPSDLMSDGAIPVDRKHARSRIAKTAGIGRLWEEIQRLETLVEILQDKKRADLEEKKEEEAAVPVIPNIPPPPPPPVPPAPPPPPPPPLAMPVPGIKLKAKEVLKPARKPLKPFQWAKIPNHMLHDTIWKKLYEEANDLVILNEDDIYELFTKKEVEVKKIQSEKKTVVRILDRKISQNIEIVLNGFKLPFETIRGAIFTLNDDILNLERLCNLAPSIPEVEVIETIKAYNGSTKELGIAEQFILSVADIPNLSKRLTSMIFRLKFQQEYDEVYPDIQTIITAIGQLKDTKAEANNRFNCPTLLHYIVRILEQQFPGTVDFIAEMDQVVYAGRMNIPNLLGCVKDLEEGLLHLEKEMDEWIEIITHPSDLFISTFQVFIVSAKDKLEDIKREMGILETRMQSLFEMYGEEESDRKDAPQTFFETIQKFSQMLKKAQMENDLIDKRIAKRLANEQKKKMEEQRKAIDNEIINEHNFADIKGVQEPEDQNTHTMELTTFLMKGVSMAEARNTIKRVKTSTRTNNLRIVDSLQIADTNTLSTSLNQFATIEEETEEDLQAKSLEDLETRSIEFGSSSSVEEL